MYTDEKFYARNDDMVIMPLRNINLIAELKFFVKSIERKSYRSHELKQN